MTSPCGWTWPEVEEQRRALHFQEPHHQQVSVAPQALQYDLGSNPQSQTVDVRHRIRAHGDGIGGSCGESSGVHAPIPHSFDVPIEYYDSSARDNFWQSGDEMPFMAPVTSTADVSNMNISPEGSNNCQRWPEQPTPDATTSELATPVPTSVSPDRSSVTRNRVATIASVKYDTETQRYWFECCSKKCDRTTCDRYQDLKRHFKATHVSPEVVCQHPGCQWSYPAVRKDKRSEHMKSKHGSAYSTSN